MNDQLPESELTPAQRWFRLSEQDLEAAEVLLRDGTAALRIAGFLAQQSAEQASKAGLFALSISAPKIHGLRQLHARYPVIQSPAVDEDDLDLLDPWVIDGRYAADLPDLHAPEAIELLAAARKSCRRRPAPVFLANEGTLEFVLIRESLRNRGSVRSALRRSNLAQTQKVIHPTF